MTWRVLGFLWVLPALAIAAAPPDAGSAGARDVVREWVAKDLALKFTAEPLAEREALQPGAVFFSNPAEPRFVTVNLELVSSSPYPSWTPHVTRFLGFHELKYVVDRRDQRIVTAPSEEALRTTVASVLRSRAEALVRARTAFGKRCSGPVAVDADFLMPSGVEDYWSFAVACDGKTFEVVAKKGQETVTETAAASPRSSPR